MIGNASKLSVLLRSIFFDSKILSFFSVEICEVGFSSSFSLVVEVFLSISVFDVPGFSVFFLFVVVFFRLLCFEDLVIPPVCDFVNVFWRDGDDEEVERSFDIFQGATL